MKTYQLIIPMTAFAVILMATKKPLDSHRDQTESLYSGTKTQFEPKASVSSEGFEEKIWELEELRFMQKNEPDYFNRNDREKSTVRFSGDYYIFSKDGKGVYHQADHKEYKLTWKYVNAEKTAIDFIIENFRSLQPLTVHWEKIRFDNNSISYVEYYTHVNGVESLGYGTRVTRSTDCGYQDLVIN